MVPSKKKKNSPIASVRNLTYTNEEMLLRDDCSLDTWEVLLIYHTVLYRAESSSLHK